jgi:molybdopterin converting factor subunit 1
MVKLAVHIRVLLFASLREAAGTSELSIEIRPQSPVREVLSALSESIPGRDQLLARCALAINEQYADGDTVLHDGDIVAVIPPVSGGATN